MYVEHVYPELDKKPKEYKRTIEEKARGLQEERQNDTTTLELALSNKRNELKLEKALERAEDMFLRGKFDELKLKRYQTKYDLKWSR